MFDLGKVLVDFDYSIAARKIAERCSPRLDHDRVFSDHAALLFRYEVGQINTEQFFDEMRRSPAIPEASMNSPNRSPTSSPPSRR